MEAHLNEVFKNRNECVDNHRNDNLIPNIAVPSRAIVVEQSIKKPFLPKWRIRK